VQVRESGGRIGVERDKDPGVAWEGPLAVLVNRSSASASEIFAAAIQDYGRGLIIGETTFGKGTVQNLIDLDRWPGRGDEKFGQVKLTIAQFFRVNGNTTQFAGVAPDIAFPVTVDATLFGESTYDNALPASRIGETKHASLGNFDPLLPRLMAQHNARVQKDQEYQWLLQDVARFRSEREKKSISLNEAERRAERDRNEARRKEREAQRKAMGLAALDGDDKDDGLQTNERGIRQQVAQEEAAKNRPDPLLRESAAILADAIAQLSGNPQLTTQVLPVTKRAMVWSQ
jgi:carboxyl-terminal processing protease